ncbi:phosphatidate cytidylyltransferase [Marinicrinis lubricantis]|uniref:Phosphatidate cytidylyltransferase n=1 Tax=Marinicrinis lubricantis TaxID=2086470 RepID=A0ABW1IMF8_9BACL
MKQRLITGVLAAIVFLFLLYFGGAGYTILILALALIGLFEFVRLNRIAPFGVPALIGYAAVAWLTIPWEHYEGVQFYGEQMIWISMLVFFAVTVTSKNRINVEQAALLFLGVVYVGTGFHYMLSTRLIPEDGLFWTLLIFISIWVSDIGAYFTGRAIGKHLLWPAISPKKTVEGAVGGLILSIAAALLFSLYSPERLDFIEALWIGLAASVIGQLGDFIQSAYKRARGVKDSGTLLPGHGGVLDRCDSWIIVFPFIHFMSLIPV